MNRPNPQRERRPSQKEPWPEERYLEDRPPRHAKRSPNYPPPERQKYWWEEEEFEEEQSYHSTYRQPPRREQRQGPPRTTTRPAPRNRSYEEHPPHDSYGYSSSTGAKKRHPNASTSYGDYESYDRPAAPRPKPRARSEPYESHAYSGSFVRNQSGQFSQRPRGKRPVQPRSRTHDYQLEQEQREKSAYRKIGVFLYNLLFYSLTVGILLMSVMFAFSDKGDASIFGYRFYNVLTNSMAPVEGSPAGGFYSGDMVLVQMKSGADVQAGDIVTYRVGDGSQYLTHRMIERLDELNGEEGDYLITKGDANQAPDPPVSADRVLGKVLFAIPKLGTLISFFRENIWLSGLLLVTLFAFLVVFKAYLFSEETRKEQTQSRYSHDFNRNHVI